MSRGWLLSEQRCSLTTNPGFFVRTVFEQHSVSFEQHSVSPVPLLGTGLLSLTRLGRHPTGPRPAPSWLQAPGSLQLDVVVGDRGR